MAILQFIKPDKVILLSSDDFKGQFEFRPLESGFGLTIGNALRRVLLSSLEGYAISSIKIEGVEHEFSTIPGVIEDVTEIILNLKQLRLKALAENQTAEQVFAKISGQTVITGADLGKSIKGFEVLNPDLVICNMNKDVNFEITFNIEKGRGYVPSEQNKSGSAPLGTIAIDSIFTPIKKVKYAIENYRVEQKTDYEKLVLDIETDGSITPQNALTEASKILIYHFMLFSDERITLETEAVKASIQYDEETLHTRQLLKSKLEGCRSGNTW
jgi:DNA-directed RNA polymerase subunit alpha